MKKHKFRPESLMMSYGYNPHLSEGAIKCPIFQTSTFVFHNAEEGKRFFEIAYGIKEKEEKEELGLIYSRLNNPDLEILENRLTLWDEAEDCAVFESGMSAISTAMMEFLKPGDLLLYSNPLYGGTVYLIEHILTDFGINIQGFSADMTEEELIELVEASGMGNKLGMIFLETPGNPTNSLIDIEMCRRIADHFSTEEKKVMVAVDNTYLGPVFQHPIKHGADLVLYSATKYIGGHSDVIAGAVLGSSESIKRIKNMRTFFGNMAGPWTGWLLMRSLETLKIRMERQVKNAKKVAAFLANHPKVENIHYLGLLTPEDGRQYEIFKKQCLSTGAMISLEIRNGGEKEAFRFLNSLRMIKLAVSLGSTESLAQHPATMTHADVPEEEKDEYGIKENLVRLSIGVENVEDLIWDIGQALDEVPEPTVKEGIPYEGLVLR
jgi:methionine-gamma-lyase